MTDLPRRIRRRRTTGWQMPPGAVYVGRHVNAAGKPTLYGRWGNPFSVGDELAFPYADVFGERVRDLAHAVEVFRAYASISSGYAMSARLHLAGLDLVCWCPLDGPCHADVLLEVANTTDPYDDLPSNR